MKTREALNEEIDRLMASKEDINMSALFPMEYEEMRELRKREKRIDERISDLFLQLNTLPKETQ